MSNTFYEILMRTQNGTNKVKHGVHSGLTSDYELIYPNKPPTNLQSLRYNASTGLLEWYNSIASDIPVVVSTTEPTSKVDGMLWVEPGNLNAVEYWEWDASNSIWWSNVKKIIFPYPLLNQVLITNTMYHQNTNIRKNVLLRAGFHCQVVAGNSPTNYYKLFVRSYNNVGAIDTIFEGDSLTFTQPNNAGAVYRNTADITAKNVSGAGRIRFVDNLFTFDSYIWAQGQTNVSFQPYGEMFLTLRHERKLA